MWRNEKNKEIKKSEAQSAFYFIFFQLAFFLFFVPHGSPNARDSKISRRRYVGVIKRRRWLHPLSPTARTRACAESRLTFSERGESQREREARERRHLHKRVAFYFGAYENKKNEHYTAFYAAGTSEEYFFLKMQFSAYATTWALSRGFNSGEEGGFFIFDPENYDFSTKSVFSQQ